MLLTMNTEYMIDNSRAQTADTVRYVAVWRRWSQEQLRRSRRRLAVTRRTMKSLPDISRWWKLSSLGDLSDLPSGRRREREGTEDNGLILI